MKETDNATNAKPTQLRKNGTTSIPTQNVEIIDVVTDSEVMELRVSTSKILKEYDKSHTMQSGERSMEQIWDECCRYQDTNELVRTSMNQIMILFQKAWDEFFLEQKANEARLRTMYERMESLTGDEEEIAFKQYHHEKDRFSKRRIDDMKMLDSLAKTSTRMANEYRQCRTAQAYYFHISQVMELKSLFIAVIHQNVHNQQLLENISNQLSDGCLKLFPTSMTGT